MSLATTKIYCLGSFWVRTTAKLSTDHCRTTARELQGLTSESQSNQPDHIDISSWSHRHCIEIHSSCKVCMLSSCATVLEDALFLLKQPIARYVQVQMTLNDKGNSSPYAYHLKCKHICYQVNDAITVLPHILYDHQPCCHIWTLIP